MCPSCSVLGDLPGSLESQSSGGLIPRGRKRCGICRLEWGIEIRLLLSLWKWDDLSGHVTAVKLRKLCSRIDYANHLFGMIYHQY
jgi:hypothetical protein